MVIATFVDPYSRDKTVADSHCFPRTGFGSDSFTMFDITYLNLIIFQKLHILYMQNRKKVFLEFPILRFAFFSQHNFFFTFCQCFFVNYNKFLRYIYVDILLQSLIYAMNTASLFLSILRKEK